MIALGCDHGGFQLMQSIMKYLDRNNYEYKYLGTYSEESCDYPEFAKKVAVSITSGESDRGILTCGTGLGINIAANRYKGIRAALCTDTNMARLSRDHNNANVLCLGGRTTDTETALEIVRIFLTTPFSEGERHMRRIEEIDTYPYME